MSGKCKRGQTRARKAFMADSPEALAQLPSYARSVWTFVDSGRMLFDNTLIDYIRAAATRSSWQGIADVIINEMKVSRWARHVRQRYLSLCDAFGIILISNYADMLACDLQLAV